MTVSPAFSDYIIYVDESGDHNMTTINQQNPVFVLAFCVFKKSDYTETVVPSSQKLKFKYWGHDNVILHSRDIRKASGEFSILQNSDVRESFLKDMNVMMEKMPYTIIATAIDKLKHSDRYVNPANPYKFALQMCLERLERWLEEYSETEKLVHLLFERRGKAEDDIQELEFHRFYENNKFGASRKIKFMSKQHNSTGLQFADLVAYPIARCICDPAQPNRAFELIKSKFRKGANGKYQGYGLKIFP